MIAFSEGGAAGGDLERVEAAPGDPEHPRGPGAPGLVGEPGEHLDGVLLLLGQVLVEQHALGVAAAAHVHPHGGVAVAGEVGVARGVADRGPVAPAVGDVLEQRRHRLALRVVRQPDLRGQPAAVGHGDPGVVDHRVGTREVRPDTFHGCSSLALDLATPESTAPPTGERAAPTSASAPSGGGSR